MKLSIELFISLCFIMRWVGSSQQTFLYERMHNFGLGRRVIPRYKQFESPYAYPAPLPSSAIPIIPSPYRNLYQGSRMTNDTRVYRRRFHYQPKAVGHRVLSEGLFDCIITHLAIETTDGIPIILRGGAGYRFFNVVIKAKPGDQLKGSVRAYCKRSNGT
ncbi:uncharacterized protein LOC115445667 [Manduca sexta]|uniref:uncharacterized protein LOC115445667 n=1 Tax=Manduca sexta TaxID=7130 RepID=UPI001183F076|nr:uncharacterized protein LOC115445667 [Manduca sexta]